MILPQSPPRDLSKKAKAIWKRLVAAYSISDDAGLTILEAGLRSYDRAEAARKAIDADGMLRADKFGIDKPHPLIPAERDHRAAWLNAIKMLNFDLEAVQSIGRPTGFSQLAKIKKMKG